MNKLFDDVTSYLYSATESWFGAGKVGVSPMLVIATADPSDPGMPTLTHVMLTFPQFNDPDVRENAMAKLGMDFAHTFGEFPLAAFMVSEAWIRTLDTKTGKLSGKSETLVIAGLSADGREAVMVTAPMIRDSEQRVTLGERETMEGDNVQPELLKRFWMGYGIGSIETNDEAGA